QSFNTQQTYRSFLFKIIMEEPTNQQEQDALIPKPKISPLKNSISEETITELQFQNRLDLSELQQSVHKIKEEIGKVIVGQKDMIDMLIAALLAKGHALIEGVPGVAKTITAKLIAKSLSVDFSR